MEDTMHILLYLSISKCIHIMGPWTRWQLTVLLIIMAILVVLCCSVYLQCRIQQLRYYPTLLLSICITTGHYLWCICAQLLQHHPTAINALLYNHPRILLTTATTTLNKMTNISLISNPCQHVHDPSDIASTILSTTWYGIVGDPFQHRYHIHADALQVLLQWYTALVGYLITNVKQYRT